MKYSKFSSVNKSKLNKIEQNTFNITNERVIVCKTICNKP